MAPGEKKRINQSCRTRVRDPSPRLVIQRAGGVPLLLEEL
jgi:hypothetical protein